jgi:O-antigen ligase
VVASYAAAFTRPISAQEISAADRGIISLAAWAGVVLLTADGVDSRERLDTLLRRLVLVATIIAAVGILQFFTGIDLAGYLRLPGLTPNADLTAIAERSVFRRVAGTAIHPIEFGVVLALVVPVALHHAFTAPRGGVRPWLPVILLGVAIPMSLSRSAILGLVVGGIVLFAGWSRRERVRMMIVLPVFTVCMRMLVPGLLGTIKSLFLNLASDPSYQGRTDDYAVVGRFIAERPLFGRGFSTFDPIRYVLLDNQYLGTTIETGFIGLAALILLFLIAAFTARGARRRSHDPAMRDLGQALAASVVIAMVGFVTFDALAFPMATGLTFFVIGCAGAAWRLAGAPTHAH